MILKNAKVTYSGDVPPAWGIAGSHRTTCYWEITADDGRWWSVAYRRDEENHAVFTITNSRGSNLDPHGPTGQKLLDVVHSHQRLLSKPGIDPPDLWLE